jgi:bifunctional UDP-N-acetylglucosamine pyrophosphorylase/glucosamine-1-phosphate N-acetyltransferase
VLGVNSPVQLAELERRCQRRQAEALMEAGVRLADPARFDVRGSCTAARTWRSTSTASSRARCTLGDGVRIGANCVIRDASIAAGAVIHPFTHIDGAHG